MLQVTIPERELWDRKKDEFVVFKGQTLALEHSLVSISKWESKWQKPFLAKGKKTSEELRDYIRCMTITQNVNPLAYLCLTKQNIDDITAYIDSPMTATTFSDKKEKSPNKQVITSELIYYWMIEAGVPFECEKWHINRLLTLIQVCGAERERLNPNNKNRVPKGKQALNYAEMNRARLKAHNTKG